MIMEDKTKESLHETLCLEDDQPEISPYTGPALDLRIGSRCTRYTVQRFLFAKHPKLLELADRSGLIIKMPEVNDDIGHTFVHFLYHGKYQTLKPPGATGPPDNETEYRRGILVYCTARLYRLERLIDHAMAAIERFGVGLTIAQILDITCDAYAKLPVNEVWLSTYLESQLKVAFTQDEKVFVSEEYLKHIGRDPTYSKELVKIMAKVYADIYTGASTSSNSPHRPKEAGDLPLESFEGECLQEEAIESGSVGEDFEDLIPTPCLSEDTGNVDVDVEPPIPTSPPKDELNPDINSEQLFMDELPPMDDVSPRVVEESLLVDDASSPEDELILVKAPPNSDEDGPPLAALEGLCCECDGFIKDIAGNVIGKVIEGDAAEFSRKMYFCDANGAVCDYKNKPVGKCTTLGSGKPKEEKDIAGDDNIWSWSRASQPSSKTPPAPKADNTIDIWGTWGVKDTVGEKEKPAETTESSLPPLSILKGRTVDADGKVYNDDNIAIGECIEGDVAIMARRKYLINGKGRLKTRGGKVMGKCVVLAHKNQVDPPPPPPEPVPVEEPVVCPEQVQHMRNGGSWKTCRMCCKLIRHLSIQLSDEDTMTDEGVA